MKFLACVDFFFFFFWKRETKRYTGRDWGIGILSDGNIEKESVNTFYVLTKRLEKFKSNLEIPFG